MRCPTHFCALFPITDSSNTSIQLIERFYEPVAGEVYVSIPRLTTHCAKLILNLQFDGEKISESNVQDYRKYMALVSQKPTLYAGTVRFNILLGATKPPDEVTQEGIEKACQDANLLEYLFKDYHSASFPVPF